jgi:glutamyl-tRNA synthetase
MAFDRVRTRFAPSPTGFMHIGNLRTALFEYLIAKAEGGDFVLRIEDTDRERMVEGAVDKIYKTMALAGLKHDEGPDIGGDYGPYVQSERLPFYKKYAEELVQKGQAYYCFCTPERLEKVHADQMAKHADFIGYDRHCRDLSPEEVEERLAKGEPYVIRQKMPDQGVTSYEDQVFGLIEIENKTLEDQVLLKSDGYPTYNFANVVDDHDMRISHVVRGSEYLSSTPKYILLYEAFGYDVPTFVHLPLILGADGQKLSKRHGATSFEELLDQGFLPEAIVNYLGLLGWDPKSTRELFTLEDLEELFNIRGISKSPAVFDIQKLVWFNEQYLRAMSLEDFKKVSKPYIEKVLPDVDEETLNHIASLIQARTGQLTDIPDQIAFLGPDFHVDAEDFIHKKSKSTLESSRTILKDFLEIFSDIRWEAEALHLAMLDYVKAHGLKNGTVMWPIRIGASGQKVTPGGASDVLILLGKEKALAHLEESLKIIEDTLAKEI